MPRELNSLQRAFVEYVGSIQPNRDTSVAAELDRVRTAVASEGFWQEHDEWRISTYFDTRIDKEELNSKPWFKVRVECDMQEFSCRCPSLEKAFLLSKFYRHLIVNQFYSVGPPWA